MSAPICLRCCRPIESADGKCRCGIITWKTDNPKPVVVKIPLAPCLGCNRVPCQCDYYDCVSWRHL